MAVIVAALCGALLAGAGGASARPASGLACLQGTWVSGPIQSSSASGVSRVRLAITRAGAAVTDYTWSTPLRFPGSTIAIYLRGISRGRFHVRGRGYTFTPGSSTEKYSAFLGSTRVKGPLPVAHPIRYVGLRCGAGTLSDQTTLPGAGGSTISASITFHPAG